MIGELDTARTVHHLDAPIANHPTHPLVAPGAGHPPQPAVEPQRWSSHYAARMRVSSKGDYACRALLSLTLHASDPGPTSVRDIAERTAIPQPYLEQILLALKGAGLVRSKRGVGGGYVLARLPDEIRLSEILAAVDGPISLGDFGDPHQDGSCNHEGQCVLYAIWKLAGEHMRQLLHGFTLADVASVAEGQSPWPDRASIVAALVDPV
jgi:Rrf2 family iron-sulfur cluster assembly transcriptional regulator